MSFKHTIEGSEYEVLAYKLGEDGDVDDMIVLYGCREIPLHHLDKAILDDLEEACRQDDIADAMEGRRFAAECAAEAA